MPQAYRMTVPRRIFNWIMRGALRTGLAPSKNWLLTTRGRKSGKAHSIPVSLVEEAGQRWLVSPYGAVGWVHNVRASGDVTLSRGKQTLSLRAIEVGPDESAPILKLYLGEHAITRPFFDETPDSSVEEFRKNAAQHPVFKLVARGEGEA